MNKKIRNSLSNKILLSIILVSVVVVFIIYTVIEQITKETFYNIERDKATIIVNTVEPLIAINLYLGIPGKIESLVDNLLKNPNILSVKVLSNNETVIEKNKINITDAQSAFKIEENIFQPNSKKIIGKIILHYSSQNYQELRNKYKTFTLLLLIILSILFILLSLYIKKLIAPLHKIAKLLRNYKPNKEINIPYRKGNDEIALIANSLNDMQKKIVHYSRLQKDINKHLEELVSEKTLKLKQQLYTNSLTELPNRLSLLEEMGELQDGALIIINIDDFKEINDFFGHLVGDSVLVSFAKKLKQLMKEYETVNLKHLHGDEFALLFTKKPHYSTFLRTIKKILREIETMVFSQDTNEFGVRVTIGAVYEIEGALEKADIALKLAKKKHLTYLIYDENLHIEKQYQENIEWIKKLKYAIDNDRIVPFFQPIYDNRSNKIVSCECLMRLIDEDGSVISPYKFLSVAKRSRLYNTLTKIMIRKSCQYFENIECDFSINLSIADMLDSDIKNYIRTKVTKHKVSNKIVLEILETEGIENYDAIAVFIDEMKMLGCKIAIDDFGSGYSNFEYLLKLNIDYIKIDGTLIRNIDEDKNAAIVAKTVVDFAGQLQVKTIAEFVHNEEVFEKVKELKIDRSQGFYLAEPQKEVRELIVANHKYIKNLL